MPDRARSPRRPRPAPQTWPLRPHRAGAVRLLAALGYGAGAALLAFALVLAVSAVIA